MPGTSVATILTVTRVDGLGRRIPNAKVGDSVWLIGDGGWKRGTVRYITGDYAGVKLLGENRIDEWPLSALVAS